MSSKANIFAAIDCSDFDRAYQIADAVTPYFKGIKLGLEFFTRFGTSGIKEFSGKVPTDTELFLDLKFHDIPNTVHKAIENILEVKPDFITIHAAGGADMMRAAAKSVKNTDTKILAVTVLTSLDEKDIKSMSGQTLERTVLSFAKTAIKSGIDGLVCSPHEIEILRREFGPDLKLVVPGIRLNSNSQQDQKRIMSPEQAFQKGADYLVIGRAVTQSDATALAAKAIAESVEQLTKAA